MLVTTRHAEEKLLTFQEKIKENPAAWRAIYFFQGETEEYRNRDEVRLQVVVNTVKRLLTQNNENVEAARLFFFTNNDIVLVAPGLGQEVLQKIAQALEGAFPAEKGQPSVATAYDLSISFASFKELIQQKCSEAHNIEAGRHVKGTAGSPREITVSEDYGRDILKRRPLRENLLIQLVEDDAFTLSLIETVLGGRTVLKTMDGVDAIETYMLNAPDIVFLDINLPSLNGHEVLRRILDFDSEAFVVMLSGNSYLEDVSRAIKAGAKGFVTKPFPKEKLLNYIKIYETGRKAAPKK